MDGELAQIISLVAHGNLYLHDSKNATVDLSGNSTIQYVSSIKFTHYKSDHDTHGLDVANNISDWFTFLRSNQVTRLWNIAFEWKRQDIPEHVAVAFAGGVPRAIQADLQNGYELWYPQWKTGGQDKKPWLVEYRSLMFPNSFALPTQKLSAVKNRLKKSIAQAEKFSHRPDVNAKEWTDWFTKALVLLNSPNPKAPFHLDMLPDLGFSLEARQIIASATQAYVFGGMGSWNELGFEKSKIQKEYDKISKELFDTIKLGLVMASNSFEL